MGTAVPGSNARWRKGQSGGRERRRVRAGPWTTDSSKTGQKHAVAPVAVLSRPRSFKNPGRRFSALPMPGARRALPALLIALALLAGAPHLADGEVEAAQATEIKLARVTDILIDATPGTPHTVQVELVHVSGPDATVTLWAQAPMGWATSPLETVQLQSGQTVAYEFTFTAEEAKRHNNVTLNAGVMGAPSNQPLLGWLVRTPIQLDVAFDPQPSVAHGLRGTVTATWADGSPVAGQEVWLIQVPRIGLGDLTPGSYVEGPTDDQGVYTFDYGVGWTARTPGEHFYYTGTIYGDWDHPAHGTFEVTVV